MKQILNRYQFDDMMVCYEINDEKQAGLFLYPADKPLEKCANPDTAIDSLVQLKIAGDMYNGAYAPGNTLRNGESTIRMKYVSQKLTEENNVQTVITVMEDDRGYQVTHKLSHVQGEKVLRAECEFLNKSAEAVKLEMFESVSLSEISPYISGDEAGELMVHRLQSRWSQEGRLLSQSLEELQLDVSWTKEAVRCERFGQAGSLPVNHYFPFLGVEDRRNHIFWGMQVAHNASWQMEIYRIDENLAISGGLADREFGHWMKNIAPGESFLTPEAIITVCHADSVDFFTRRLADAGQNAADAGPECEQDLPIVFNEYCTTWGNPSHENICEILKTIKGKGFTYFVIDCGWYKREGVPWDISMGDYDPSGSLFPMGLEQTVQEIRNAGLKPGIWFEIENVGQASEVYNNTEHLLHLDGKPLTTTRRRFWDMTDPWVNQYLTEHVIEFLKKYGFEYMKMDYNDTVGMGCDGYESIGEGLRQNMAAAREFVEKVKKEIPGIVLENCASGGHRLEPGYMALTSMASFSDAHECVEIPVIAANLHRVILPRQSQIWAVIRKTDSLKRISYSVAATFLGRMCISGDVWQLNKEQWAVIDNGIAFYKKIASVIKRGQSYHFGTEIKSIRHPDGWQAVLRIGDNGKAYIVLHTFMKNVPDKISFSLPENCPSDISDLFSWEDKKAEIRNRTITFYDLQQEDTVAVFLE